MQSRTTKSHAFPPIGIMLRSLLVGIRGLQLVLICLLALATLIPGASFPIYTWLAKFPVRGHVLVAVIAMILALVSFACVWGLWHLRRWALWAVVVAQVVSILMSLMVYTRMLPQWRDIVADIFFPAFVLFVFLVNKRIRTALLHA